MEGLAKSERTRGSPSPSPGLATHLLRIISLCLALANFAHSATSHTPCDSHGGTGCGLAYRPATRREMVPGPYFSHIRGDVISIASFLMMVYTRDRKLNHVGWEFARGHRHVHILTDDCTGPVVDRRGDHSEWPPKVLRCLALR